MIHLLSILPRFYECHEEIKDFFYKDLRLVIGNGLVTSEGKYWRKQRKLSQPAFHKKSIDNFSEIIREEALLTIAKWNSLENNNINLLQEMKEVTMSIVSRCLFDIDIKRNAKELSNAIDGVLEYLNNRIVMHGNISNIY